MVQVDPNKIRGAVYGSAYGDGWGWLTEFSTFKEANRARPRFPFEVVVTDDTQMALYVMDAVTSFLSNGNFLAVEGNTTSQNAWEKKFRLEVAEKFVEFGVDPDNNRAPGNTCLKAIETLNHTNPRVTGLEGTVWRSIGCGSNMRTGWLGLLDADEETAVLMGVAQAEVTHGGAEGLAATAITTSLVWNFYRNNVSALTGVELLWWVANQCDVLSDTLPWGWRGQHIREGFTALQVRIVAAIARYQDFSGTSLGVDVCSFFGEGWVAPEALINAVAVFAAYGENAVDGLQRLVVSGGDSDSIACIGGVLFGAAYGEDVFPSEWRRRFEPRYRYELARAVTQIVDTW